MHKPVLFKAAFIAAVMNYDVNGTKLLNSEHLPQSSTAGCFNVNYNYKLYTNKGRFLSENLVKKIPIGSL